MLRPALITVALALGACATMPANYGTPARDARVGLLILLDETPTHMHVGMTIFNNFTRDDASATDFRSQYKAVVADAFARSGYDVVSVPVSDEVMENRHRYGRTGLSEDDRATLNTIAAENDLDFVTLVYPVSGPAWANSSAYLEGYGLYVRCAFSSCTAHALNYVSSYVYDVAAGAAMAPIEFRFYEYPGMPGIIVPKDRKAIPAEKVDEAAAAALEYFTARFELMLQTAEFTP